MSMEKRAILAAVLMAVVLILYQYLFIPSAPEAPAERPRTEAAAPKPEPPPAPRPAAVAPLPLPSPAPAEPAGPRPPQRLATVETPHYRAVVSSEGGKLQELTLKYRGERPLVVVGELGPAGLVVAPAGGPAEVVPMRLSTESLTLGPGDERRDLVLRGEADGLAVRETLTFGGGTFVIEAAIRIVNSGRTPREVTVALPWVTRQAWRETAEKFPGQHPTELVWSAGGAVQRAGDLCQPPALSTDGAWIATGSTWYMAALIPRSDGFRLVGGAEDGKACEAPGKEAVGRATIAVQATPTIAPGQAWEGQVTIFVGPKEYDRLRALGLERAINFGGFPIPRDWGGLPMEWVGVPILLLMNWVYSYVGNYGIAIILLTIVTKLLFYPLTMKSMRSMKGMQALQPQVNALRAKYKSDPQRLQRETLALYRKHKVNPMGGCLPMIAQVPIFYALYLALSLAVELQNAEFLCVGRVFGVDLWICDLSSHDPTYVLPILMGVSMFVQQKMTPMTGDPRQAKMMLFMPVIFTFMFLNLPSGLVLYWTVSNVLQILQQWYMDRARPARAAREARSES